MTISELGTIRDLAKRILANQYEKVVYPFKQAILAFQQTRHCSIEKAAELIAAHTEKTGHGAMLVFSALADLLDNQEGTL